MDALVAYLPEDRAHALAGAYALPDRAHGTALFADISGFTSLTEALSASLGPRAGVEALTDQINHVYAALIAAVARWRGSVISFSGDAITCWFDDVDEPAPLRAAACALELQEAMAPFVALAIPNGPTIHLALKVAVASGPARRFVVGDPTVQYLDALAGATLTRVAAGEHLAQPGEILLDADTAEILGSDAILSDRRTDPVSGESFTLLQALAARPAPAPWEPVILPAEVVRPWLHPVVWARYQAGLGTFLTELRPAVALFVRFGGIDFDDDDAAGDQLDAVIRRVQAICAQGGGVLLQLTIGDKGSYVFVVFGALVAHEDDARRATRAALALHAATAELSLPPLQIGISQGTLRCGASGGPTRITYGAQGDDVNLAARLMMLAAPGETVLSGRVQTMLDDTITLDPRPPLLLKGKAEPLPVFAVTGGRPQRAIRLQEPSYALPMVGRQTELQTIGAQLDRAAQGHGQVVAIVAEAGMGKSRLVAEVVRAARRRRFIGYGGSCQADRATIPYTVWKPIWSAFFGVDPEQPLRRSVRLLEGVLEDLAPYASSINHDKWEGICDD